METSAEVETAAIVPPVAVVGKPNGRYSSETFVMANESSFVPSTLDAKNRTVDVVWYGGATVPRFDYDLGKYMLRLDMSGARLDRLNNGAPFFDNHMSGTDYASHSAGLAGSSAQLGTVQKAWAQGQKGMATIKFDAPEDGEEPDDDDPSEKMFQGIASGKFRNLSFGTFIYAKQLESSMTDAAGNKMDTYVATDWEPYEISQANVPADYTTTFLTAQTEAASANITLVKSGDRSILTIPQNTSAAVIKEFLSTQVTDLGEAGVPRVTTPRAEAAQTPKETVMETTVQPAGDQARVNEAALAAARADAIKLERERTQAIRVMTTPFKLDETFMATLQDLTVDQARVKVMDHLATQSGRFQTTGEMTITRDADDTRRECMEAALLMRHNPNYWADQTRLDSVRGNQTLIADYTQRQADMRAKGRQYVHFSLVDLAKESLDAHNISTRGMSKLKVVELALDPHRNRIVEMVTEDGGVTFGVGAESSSDFPAVLANVANKTLRQAYQASARTFTPLCRIASAADFKPINRVQLSDLAALSQLNEKGEYHRAQLSDSNETYSLATFGEIVALTRKVIINDDLQAFTRVPMQLGVAAARLESDKVWAVFTVNANMGDGVALFHATHANLFTGGGSALGVPALATAKAAFRKQTGPKGTYLNLEPRYLVVPTELETTALQLIAPMNLAVTAVTAGVPEWIRSLTPVVEPRLSANSATAWYLVADTPDIDTIEYAYLEGQEGVYMETRQGFEVDGIEVKARMDFGAKAIDWRGLQKNAGV